jgi:knotted carbamoyltransferase YgeW
MSWAYSPSYGKPLSVPQGSVALLSRFGMNVVLAHPEGYELLPEVLETADRFSRDCGGSLRVSNDMGEAFEGADVVYPKSWAPLAVMRQRTGLLGKGEQNRLQELEAACLAQNMKHRQWECTEELMSCTKDGNALYMHCLPADITGLSCKQGEVAASVFERYRLATYREASCKPFVIAAMILLMRVPDPVGKLETLISN